MRTGGGGEAVTFLSLGIVADTWGAQEHLQTQIQFSFSLQNVHILPRTVLYMADSETFISLEECRGHKRGIYRKKGWVFVSNIS